MRQLGPDARHLSINTATLNALSLPAAVEAIAGAGIPALAPWRHKVHEHGLAPTARLIRDAGLKVSGLCRGGMFPAADAAGRRAAIEDNRRAIAEAAALEAACLVLVTGGLPAGSRDLPGARAQVRDALAELLPEARDARVPLAIEPLHPMYAADRAVINTMAQALDLCDALGPGIGIAVDVYHVWWDPDLERQIERCGRDRLLAFHICDWLVPTRDLLLDRGMMGDGVIDIPRLRGLVEAQGFSGFCEVEIFSEANWWKRPAAEVLATCRERYATVC